MCAHYLGIKQLQVGSCHFWAAKKKRHSIICDALVFCWHRTQPEIGQLQGAHSELLWKEAWPHHFSGLALCWHRIPPEIGQLQGAPHELQWKEALLHCLSGLGLCWHHTPPKIGQLQGALPEQPWKEASFHRLWCLGLCWRLTQPKIGQFQDAPARLLWKEAFLHCLSCLGLCWHRTQPEIGQLRGAHSELLRKEPLFHHPSCLGLCWHRTPPEIGQPQAAPDKLLCKEALLHHLRCLGLCWPLLLSAKTRFWDFQWGMLHTRASLHLHLQNWDFGAGSSAAQEACHHFPHMPPWCPDPAPCQAAETPGSQAVQLEGIRYDCQSRSDHPVESCLEGAVVGSVGCQSSVPSAASRPSPNLLQSPLLQKPQLIHRSLRKALPAWDNCTKKAPETRN